MQTRQLLTAAILALVSTTAGAQAAAKVKEGDAALLKRNPAGALAAYDAALKTEPKNVTALWHAAHAAVISGEYAKSDVQDSMYSLAESYARRAVDADSNSVGARFALAEVLGRIAQKIDSPISKLPYSREVYANVNACLKLDPKNAECDHILGVWNLEVMKVDEGQRSMAVSFMGATEIGEASFDKAIAYLQRAIAIEPKRVVHHLDLGRVYATKGDAAKAKAEFNTALKLPSVDYNDGHYKDDAKKALADLAKQ